MRIAGEVTVEMGMEAYNRSRHCGRCGKQFIEARSVGGSVIFVDLKTYKARAGLVSLYYEINPINGKLVDGVQWAQPIDLKSGVKRGWRLHSQNCEA